MLQCTSPADSTEGRPGPISSESSQTSIGNRGPSYSPHLVLHRAAASRSMRRSPGPESEEENSTASEASGQGDSVLAFGNPGTANTVREELGSVNWSQSTSSSRTPPEYTVHSLADSSKKSGAGDSYLLKVPVSPTRDTAFNKPAQGSTPPTDHNGTRLDNYSVQNPAPGFAEQPADIGTISPTHGPFRSSDRLLTLHSAIQQTGFTHEGSAFETESARPFAIDSSTNYISKPTSQASSGPGFVGRERSPSPTNRERVHGKQQQSSSQKAMLSKALQKANTAVLLDNAANFEGAMKAYDDACQLLQLVLLSSNGSHDEKLKLQEICDTYTIRITELRRLDTLFQQNDMKALPARPSSEEEPLDDLLLPLSDEGEEFPREDVHSPRNDDDLRAIKYGELKTLAPEKIPPRRQSLLHPAVDSTNTPGFEQKRPNAMCKSSWQTSQIACGDERLLPALSPRKPQSHNVLNMEEYSSNSSHFPLLDTGSMEANGESTSWLDTIDESGASSPSTHSKMSSVYLRRKRSRSLSYGTEAEFDAALDAAVEAAYDEGLEPEMEENSNVDGDAISNSLANLDLEKPKLPEARREADIGVTGDRRMPHIQNQGRVGYSSDPQLDYLDEESEEEERLLEEMTRDIIVDGFEFGLQSKPTQAKQPRSKEISEVWKEPARCHTIQTRAMASSLAENTSPLPKISSEPEILANSLPASTPTPLSGGQSVRSRRLSGRLAKELKIETSTRIDPVPDSSGPEASSFQLLRPQLHPSDKPQMSLGISPGNHLTCGSALPSPSAHPNNKGDSANFPVEDLSANVNVTSLTSLIQDGDDSGLSNNQSPSLSIDKVHLASNSWDTNSSSLRLLQSRNISVSTPDPPNYPGTPSSAAFPNFDLYKSVATGTVHAPQTQTGAASTPNGLPTGGLYLFDSDIHSATSPGCPNPMANNGPTPLEPCPESFLLRPFWLLRCLYQTIAHPCGGYLSTRLFVPQDAWRVKNVKIKAIEEKVSNCDLLTAALLKLAQVDTYDADAVLDEMQSLEGILDQVQASLSKKLGNEVGLQGAMSLFKLAPTSEDATGVPDNLPSKSSGGQGKSYLSSWRKLRSKNSGFVTAAIPSQSSKDQLTINSLPMTSAPSFRFTKRTVTQLHFDGPNANYMGALARLCDAAQVVDQIARQVEDPGLRHSSQTLVGLELSTRHAAEFFGFYVCRFVLNDIGMMLDKFMKRGSEWVLV